MNILSEILQLSKEFIAIKSVAGNLKALEGILDLALANLKGHTVEKFAKNGIKSALVYNTQNRPKKFRVILNGHLDVIPGREHQYKPKVIGDKLYGVGSMDMKSNVACLVMAFREVVKKVNYPLALQLVTDEQTGSLCGTKYQLEKGVRANFVIAGETTNFNIVNNAKGVMWIKVSTKGKTSHSAYPWQGDNSVWAMNVFLNKLKKKYPLPYMEVWKTTVNLSHIKTSNNSFNKIPDDCEIWLDVRYIPGEKTVVMSRLKEIVPKGFGFDIVFEEPPLQVEENNKYIKALQGSTFRVLKHKAKLYRAHGTSDTTYYARVGCPAVEFGPIGLTGNTSDEYINIPSLEEYYQILTEFLLSLKW